MDGGPHLRSQVVHAVRTNLALLAPLGMVQQSSNRARRSQICSRTSRRSGPDRTCTALCVVLAVFSTRSYVRRINYRAGHACAISQPESHAP